MREKIMNIALMSAVTIVMAGLFSACESNNNDPDKPIDKSIKEIKYLDATARDKWVYFSFSEGKAVEIANPEESLEWDFAMRRELIRVNGSEHYKGKGMVALTDKGSLDEVTDSKGLLFVGNTEQRVQTAFNMMDPSKNKYEDQYHAYLNGSIPHSKEPNKTQEGNVMVSFHLLMYKMMTEGASGMYPPQPHVFVFKSADGKSEYKVQFTGTVTAEGKNGGTLSFKFGQIK